jgi:integrase
MRVRKDLTDRAVRNLRPGYHAAGRSLYVQVTDKGSRSWILRTLVHGKRREIGLGSYPDVSVVDAHEEAGRLRKLARQGGDPLAERRRSKVVCPTFEEAATALHDEHKHGWRNSKHRAQWISTLKMYAFPVFGTLAVSEIDTHHVMDALSPIWLIKPETARRVRQRIELVLGWAKARKYRFGDNPAAEIADVLPKQPDAEKHHAAMPHKEVPAFVTKVRKASASDVIKLALEFLILTATRTSEVLGATWDEIDLEEATWTVPAERMKAGREHRVPLPDLAIEILQAAKKLGGKIYVFATPGKDAPLSNMALAMRLRRMGYSVTVHGFRSAFRVWCAERTNFPREVCEAALAHTVKGVEGDYQRSDLFDKRRELMRTWATHICPESAKVVKIRAA